MTVPGKVYGLMWGILAGAMVISTASGKGHLEDYRSVETQPGQLLEVRHWKERGEQPFARIRTEIRRNQGRGGEEESRVRRMLADRFLIEVTDPESPWVDAVLQALELESEGRVHFSPVFRVRLPNPSIEAFEAMRERLHELGKLAGFRISPDYLAQAALLPDDPAYAIHQDDLEHIGAPAAWDITTGSEDVVIAVIDSGIDFTHPELSPNRFFNPGEIPGNGLDDDGNGLLDDISGWDFSDGDNDPAPENAHGTLMAGIIGAAGDNGIGVAGTAWQCRLLSVRAGNEILPWSAIIQALDYVTWMRQNGTPVTVVNNSYGGAIDDDEMLASLSAAVSRAEQAGLLLVVAAGNDGRDNDTAAEPFYPAAFPHLNILSVAATNNADELWGSSNYGTESVDLAAPGVSIYSTLRGGGYGLATGTSSSTARVSGLAALLLAVNPHLSFTQLKEILIQSGDTVADLVGLLAQPVRINAAAALQQGQLYPQISWADGDGLLATRSADPVILSAHAAAGDASVVAVDFLADEVVLGADTDGSDGWSWAWEAPMDGIQLQLKVTDSAGRIVTTFPRLFRSLSAFDYWRYEEWGDYFASIPGAEANADPDQDGLVNLWEYAIKGSPRDGFTPAESAGQPRPVRFSTETGTFFGFELRLRSDDPDLDPYLQSSSDNLSSAVWAERVPDYFEAPSDPLAPGFRTVRIGLALPDPPGQIFLRLGIRFSED